MSGRVNFLSPCDASSKCHYLTKPGDICQEKESFK